MLICRNCNKEYTQFLKYCPSCGSELIEKKEDTPVKETGVSSITVEKEKGLTDVSESVKNSINKKSVKTVVPFSLMMKSFALNVVHRYIVL